MRPQIDHIVHSAIIPKKPQNREHITKLKNRPFSLIESSRFSRENLRRKTSKLKH